MIGREQVRTRARALAMAGLCLLLSAGPAAAQRTRDESTRRARVLFQEGQTFFNLGQFARAVEAFERGYQVKPDAIFLYNIAQAHRLGGDPAKAIFFYRSFLRNTPAASNAGDVEQKIAACQAQLDAARAGERRAAETPAPAAAPAPARTPARTEVPATPAAVVVAAAPPPPAPPPGPPRWVLGLGAGINAWRSGVPGGAGPTPSLVASAAYAPAALAAAVAQGRVAAKLALTTLPDAGGQVLFASLLVEPGARFPLTAERVNLLAGVGLGLLLMDGVKASSPLLQPGAREVTGALPALELRPSLALEAQLAPAVAVWAASSLIYDRQLDPFLRERSLVRVELSAGVAVSP